MFVIYAQMSMIIKSQWSLTQASALLRPEDETLGDKTLGLVLGFSTLSIQIPGRIRGWGSCCMIESGRRGNFSVLRRHRARLHRQQVTDRMAQKRAVLKAHTPSTGFFLLSVLPS